MASKLAIDRKLLVTDEELVRILGVPPELGRRNLQDLDSRPSGFPRKQKFWGDRRYLPHVKEYLARTSGMLGDGAARLATEHRGDRTRPPRLSSMRQHPAEGQQ